MQMLLRRYPVQAAACVLPLLLVFGSICPAAAFSGCANPNFAKSVNREILELTMAAQDAGAPAENRSCYYYAAGLLNHFEGRLDTAIADYTHAIAWMSSYPDAYAARGDAYADLGQSEKAAEDYRLAVQQGRSGPASLRGRCSVRAVRGHPLDLALADCNESLRQEPDSAGTLDSRCYVYLRMANYSAAIADCDAVLKSDPRSIDAYFLRGLAKIRSGDVAGGKADMATAIARGYKAPTNPAFGLLP